MLQSGDIDPSTPKYILNLKTFATSPVIAGPDPEGVLAGAQTLNGSRTRTAGSRSRTPVGVQGHSPWKLLNIKHRYRWNHAILAANQQNLLEKLK